MIKVALTNEILKYITEIDKNRYKVSSVKLPRSVASKLRKNSKKKSSYASNKIEGNPLSEKQVDEVIERGAKQLGWELDKLLTMTLQAMAASEDLINSEMFEHYC